MSMCRTIWRQKDKTMPKSITVIPLLFLISACMGTGVQEPQSFMPAGGASQAPKAYLDFCSRNPDECTITYSASASASQKSPETSSDPAQSVYIPASEEYSDEASSNTNSQGPVPYSLVFGRTLQHEHNHTKTLFIPTVEEGDYWQMLDSPSKGDCGDFALTLRAALRRKFPGFEGAFRIATAHTETNSYHAVLSIETDQGTIVCDNRFPQCASWDSFPYRWKLREVSGSFEWENLASAAKLKQQATAGIGKGN